VFDTIANNMESERNGPPLGLIARRPIRHDARQRRNFADPPAVRLKFDLDHNRPP
jgi:hypothetical protein